MNVEGKVVVDEKGLLLALLRFGEQGTIHEHPGPNDTLVACLEGSGFSTTLMVERGGV